MCGAACVGGPILAIIAPMTTPPIKAARTGDIPPGRMTCVEVDGRRILVANVDGVYYATDDTCTHEDASLSSGSLDGELVKCPLHGSRFSLRTGEPMEDPAEDPLRCYAVKVEDGVVLVELEARSDP
jgi:3-phenylpropionate/trans-cinnamate dioxygenase ferredoxin subunit